MNKETFVKKYFNGADFSEIKEIKQDLEAVLKAERLKLINEFESEKPMDTRGCSDPECCGDRGPDYEWAWDDLVRTMRERENG